MDSPKIAIHVILQDTLSSINQDVADQNRLYCSISQPVGSKQKNNRIINNLSTKRPITSTGMIINSSAQAKSVPSQSSILSSTSSKQQQKSRTKLESNLSHNIYHNELDKYKMALNENLKKMGWYWGSISPEYASKLLKEQQDGSFLIRDSSSECYIFSMTLKLDNEIHHTRIEHSSGYFSFGRSRKFHCTTMVDFIEQAIECSRSGDLSFFLHRGPEMMGPVEFRMIPLSRMNGLNSLKHLCRFAILPYVRKDKINELCLPECLRDYLYEPFGSNNSKPQET